MSTDTVELLVLVMEFFEGNETKARLWFETKNPLLGGISPNDMIKAGRYDKLLRWAKDQINEGKAPDAQEGSEPGK